MEKRYLIDSNVIVAFLQNALSDKAREFLSNIVDFEFNISVINKMEL